MRFVNLFLRICGFLILLAVALPVLAIALLQVPAGRSFMSGVVSELASGEGRTIGIEDLHIGFGLDAEVAQISVGDGNGPWLTAEQLVLDWRPLSLLSGDLEIASLTAERIDLDRLPVSPETAPRDAAGENNEGGGLALPLDVSLEKLSVGEVNLGEPVVGAPVSLTAAGSGSFKLDPALIVADLQVSRTDGVDAGLRANAEFEPAAETLFFDVTVSEPRGGLAARLLQVPDLPAVRLDLKGDGPLTNWAANLDIALDGRETVTGSATIAQDDAGRTLAFDLDGDLAALAPPAAQAFVKGTTKATGKATFTQDFAPRTADLSLETGTVSLRSTASLDGDAIDADATLNVSAGSDALIALDIADRRIAFGPLKAEVSVTGQRSAADWKADLDLASLQTREARIRTLNLNASGTGADLSPETMTSPIVLDLDIAELDGLMPETEPLSGPASIKGRGTLDGLQQAASFTDLTVNTAAGAVVLTDTTLSAGSVVGQGRLSLPDLSRFSGLAGRDLGGRVSGSFSTDLDPNELAGSATLSLVTSNLETGVAQADALLNRDTRIDATADLAGQDSITIKSLAVENDALNITGSAAYENGTLVSDIAASLSDLALLDPQLAGSLKLDAATSGPVKALNVSTQASSKQILLAGTPLDDLTFSADATADLDAPTAVIKSTASLNGQPVSIDVELSSRDGGAELDPLSVTLAGNTVNGALSLADLANPLATLEGNLKIDAPDLASLSPLLLTDIGGRLQGTVSADPDAQTLSMDVTGADIDLPSLSLGSVRLKADLAAPYTPQSASADIELSDLITDVTPIHDVRIKAEPQGGQTAITADVRLDQTNEDGLTLAAAVSEPDSGEYRVDLSDLSMRYQGIESKLKQPTSITYRDGDADIEPLELQLGDGSLSLAGKAGTTLDLNAELAAVPLNLANAFVPSLGLGGTLSGTVTASGSSAAPQASWEISGAGLTAAEIRNNGLSAFSLTSTGSLEDDQISQSTKVSDPNGLNLTASGTVGLAQPNKLAITLDGTVPTAALRRPMLDAGLRGDGAISLSGTVGGSAQAPTYQVTATPAGLKLTSLSTGLTVQNFQGTASVTQDTASINGVRGDLATGGTLSAGGTVGMKDGFPADLSVKLDKGRYIDPGLVTAEVDADLKITGPLAAQGTSALISGSIGINKADVSIPESLPGAIPPVDVRHVNAPKAIREQVADLGGEPQQSQTQQKTYPPRLDILLSAPGRIFIRGRGLDTELQGSLKIVGTTADPQAIGAFSLKRGQLDILTRRLVFSRGTATFEGSLTPVIDFAAATTVSDTTITVTVSGEADDPQIAFSSSPDLPQDEVLALLLFGKSIGNLSATQVARLAAAIATLTGGSDTGPLASIRKSLGLDAIDINTDGDNGPSLSVGKYINDNIYLGVEQGTGSDSSRVQVDIDLDRGLKVRGEVGADGSSKAGIFFEREY